MNLHRTGEKAEWESVEGKRNQWQKLAAATGGVVTPGNAASLAGLGIVGYGLKDILHGNTGRGIVLVGVGRIMDIVDGFLAEKTGTKSPLGEKLDVVIDKVEAAVALPVFFKADLAPKPVLGAFVGQHIANTVLTAVAKKRGNTIHPSREGKLTTGGQWGTIGLYGLAKIAGNHDLTGISDALETTAYVTTAATSLMGAKAIWGYANDALGTNKDNTMTSEEIPQLMPQLPQSEDSAS